MPDGSVTPRNMSSHNLKGEFSRLRDFCYLDHAGTALYSEAQVDAVCSYLKSNVLGNPHSSNLSSLYSHDAVDQIRFRVLKHFNTNEEEYSVVFTSGTTDGLRSVAEWFDWGEEPQGEFVYLRDVHTSVLGLREIAARQGVRATCIEHEDALSRFRNVSKSVDQLSETCSAKSLFVFPAMCNFSGCTYPLEWVEKLRATTALDDFLARVHSEKRKYQWFSLLDAAAFVPTNHLDLNAVRPDFVVFSFYKMFGYPTGLGALLVRKSSESALKKSYYGGGTVLMALSDDRRHVRRPTCHEWYEDGTINYLSIVSVRQGFETLVRLGGNMEEISQKVFRVTRYLHGKLTNLHHGNGQRVVQVYRDTDYGDSATQGGIINFNLMRADGTYIGYTEVMHVANSFGILLRTGCFCNPGACQRHLNLTNTQLLDNYSRGHTCAHNIDLIDGRPTGSVRVSFGYTSDETDADCLIKMIVECFVTGTAILKTPHNYLEECRALREKFLKNERLDTYQSSSRSTIGRLRKIYVYPIKSCGAFSVPTSWSLTKNGLKYDREWMIVSEDGVVVTQKHLPRMCLITPTIDSEKGTLSLNYSDSTISVPLENEFVASSTVPTFSSKVCRDKVKVIDCGDLVSEWLAQHLNSAGVRLVKMVTRNKTECNSHRDLSLANQAQYLLITEPSVRWLLEQMPQNSRLEQESMCRRFRSNFVVDGEFEALEEFEWDSIALGACEFQVNGPCTRCQMICVDQSSGELNRGTLTTLSTSLNGRIQFGIYLTRDLATSSVLSVNDEVVSIVKTRSKT